MKKVLLAVALVAFMASSSFAAINLECVGLINAGNTFDGWSSGQVVPFVNTQGTAVSFDINNNVSLGIGALMVSMDTDIWSGGESVMGIYANGFYKLMQSGPIAQKIGAEIAYQGWSGDTEMTAMKLAIIYRVAAQVVGPASLLVDVELLSMNSGTYSGAAYGTITQILSQAKLGLSVPIL